MNTPVRPSLTLRDCIMGRNPRAFMDFLTCNNACKGMLSDGEDEDFTEGEIKRMQQKIQNLQEQQKHEPKMMTPLTMSTPKRHSHMHVISIKPKCTQELLEAEIQQRVICSDCAISLFLEDLDANAVLPLTSLLKSGCIIEHLGVTNTRVEVLLDLFRYTGSDYAIEMLDMSGLQIKNTGQMLDLLNYCRNVQHLILRDIQLPLLLDALYKILKEKHTIQSICIDSDENFIRTLRLSLAKKFSSIHWKVVYTNSIPLSLAKLTQDVSNVEAVQKGKNVGFSVSHEPKTL